MRTMLCVLLVGLSGSLVFAAPKPLLKGAEKDLATESRLDRKAAKEIAVFYAANPAAAEAHTNWSAVWAAANNDSKKMKAIGDRFAADDAVKKVKDKAEKEKEKEKANATEATKAK